MVSKPKGSKWLVVFSAFVSIFLVLLLYIVVKLQNNINQIDDVYKIPTDQSINNTLPKGSKFTHLDAFGITQTDIPNLFGDNYLLDPNHEDRFYWTDSNNKQIDLTDKSSHIYIGIPLKPQDIGTNNPENVSYVRQIFQRLISTFEDNGFKLDTSFSKMQIYGFDNLDFVNITALENSIGTKCEVREPEQYSSSELSNITTIYSNVGYRSLVYIYIACVDKI
ncbi:MAG: hypothetical protein ABSC49_00610 [Candidatus Microgenomates bacterium]|jgi:hypothetical protein